MCVRAHLCAREHAGVHMCCVGTHVLVSPELPDAHCYEYEVVEDEDCPTGYEEHSVVKHRERAEVRVLIVVHPAERCHHHHKPKDKEEAAA